MAHDVCSICTNAKLTYAREWQEAPTPPTALLHSDYNFTNEPFSRHLGAGAALDGGLTTAGWWLRRKHRRATHRSPVHPKCILPLCEKHPEVGEKKWSRQTPTDKNMLCMANDGARRSRAEFANSIRLSLNTYLDVVRACDEIEEKAVPWT